MTTPPEDLVPIPTAAKEAPAPLRTIYRWAQAGRLKSRTVDGQQVVSLAAVRALAAARGAVGEPGIAVPGAGMHASTDNLALPAATTNPASQQADGALAAQVFAAFDAGQAPNDVVRDVQLAPKLVLELWRSYCELQQASGPRGPSLAEQIGALEQRIATLASQLELLQAQGGSVEDQLLQMRHSPRRRRHASSW